MSNINRIIFLDIDGVLNHISTKEMMTDSSNTNKLSLPISEECISVLNDIIYQSGDNKIGIVITSSWRELLSLRKLKLFFEWFGLRGNIIDILPINKLRHLNCKSNERENMIIRWLLNYKHKNKITNILILDDCIRAYEQKWIFDKLKDYLIVPSIFDGGLKKIHEDEAIEILNSKGFNISMLL